ncbi:TIGR02679 family protein [Streptomyces cynarae]|uniref:TIGR02679 family protein n=1 Tax=Streptomyces cynarae TaxID=2981134 RepID=A0ABY6EHE6_9ACTN|nr:TIGR02679 family protein [Streptomyces cynarae]UXY23368.1 TIGR02679 family protein [Streptomyces cynarae]
MTTTPATTHERYLQPEYTRLLAAARRSLERTGGRLDGTISVSAPTDAEREAIIGLTGTYRPPGTAKITIRLADLDAAIRTATGSPLAEVLTRAGGPLRNRPAEKAALQHARTQLLAQAESSPLHSTRPWYRVWLSNLATDGTLTTLINKGDTSALAHAVRVLEHLDARAAGTPPLMLPALAEIATGDTKALNPGRGPLPNLVLRALAHAHSASVPSTAEERRELWDAFDVIVDDLASRVLVLNLPAHGQGLGEWLTGAASYGTPFHITLHQLVTLPITVSLPTVYVCENPAVLRRAAQELGPESPPLICAEGRPSTAFHRLARTITHGGGTLHYHGDFDWPGIDMTSQLINLYNARPWMMTAADYNTGIAQDDDHIRLRGKPQPTPWDPELAAAMRRADQALYEEAVADALLDGLTVRKTGR